MKKTILYTRISTANQADGPTENNASLAVQLSACVKKVEAQGLEVVRHFEDANTQ